MCLAHRSFDSVDNRHRCASICIWAGITSFNFNLHCFISIFLQLSPSPTIFIYIYLTISVSLTISISESFANLKSRNAPNSTVSLVYKKNRILIQYCCSKRKRKCQEKTKGKIKKYVKPRPLFNICHLPDYFDNIEKTKESARSVSLIVGTLSIDRKYPPLSIFASKSCHFLGFLRGLWRRRSRGKFNAEGIKLWSRTSFKTHSRPVQIFFKL